MYRSLDAYTVLYGVTHTVCTEHSRASHAGGVGLSRSRASHTDGIGLFGDRQCDLCVVRRLGRHELSDVQTDGTEGTTRHCAAATCVYL